MAKKFKNLTIRKLLLSIAMLCTLALAQTENLIKYDKFSDKTTVIGSSIQLWATSNGSWFLVCHPEAVFNGKDIRDPLSVTLRINSHGPRIIGKTASPRVDLILNDSARIHLGDVQGYSIDADSLGNPAYETMFVPITIAQLKAMAEATSVEGRVGEIEFKLSAEDREKISRFCQSISSERSSL